MNSQEQETDNREKQEEQEEKFKEDLYQKIRVLNETIWENRVDKTRIDRWLLNFNDNVEKTHALFLLSQFMYFGSLQMRELLKVLYRDLFKYRKIENIRINNSNTTDSSLIEIEYSKELYKTRFLGVGNPSESGTHLLYFYRQENKLPKSLFIDSYKIFNRISGGTTSLADPTITEYVFLDDFCGSGTQAKDYSDGIVSEIKSLDSSIKTSYLMLFATKTGKDYVKRKTLFDNVEAIFELDDSFKCFNDISRYFYEGLAPLINRSQAESFSAQYGYKLMEQICIKEGVPPELVSDAADLHKQGYKDGQLLVGFHHNTPDNTLPIFWYDEEEVNWYPIFRRYNKIYN